MKGDVSRDPTFSKAHEAHKKIRMENLCTLDNKLKYDIFESLYSNAGLVKKQMNKKVPFSYFN